MAASQGTGLKYDVTRVYANLFDEIDVQPPKLGTTMVDEVGRVFRFIKNLNGSADAIGDWMCYVLSAGRSSDVNIPATGRLHLLAGVAMGAHGGAFPFGWIQTKGRCASALVTSSASHAAGTSLKVTNAGGVAAVFDQAVDTMPTFIAHAYSTGTNNPGGNNLVEVVLACSEVR